MSRPRQHPNRPIIYVWNGEVMIPLPRFRKLCDELYAVHEEYPLVLLENRNMASHNHYFAALTEGHENLAEEFAGKHPTPEHLRAWALVEAGFYDEREYEMDTPQDAKRLALMLRTKEPLARLTVKGSKVIERVPKSQSTAAMRKAEFEESKEAVLAIVAAMARTTPAQLKQQAKNHGR